MTATIYNGRGPIGVTGDQTIVHHTNSSGGNERITINYVRFRDGSGGDRSAWFDWGDFSNSVGYGTVEIRQVAAFGKYFGFAHTTGGSNGWGFGNYVMPRGNGDTDRMDFPTDLFIANGDEFKFRVTYSDTNRWLEAYSIMVIPEV